MVAVEAWSSTVQTSTSPVSLCRCGESSTPNSGRAQAGGLPPRAPVADGVLRRRRFISDAINDSRPRRPNPYGKARDQAIGAGNALYLFWPVTRPSSRPFCALRGQSPRLASPIHLDVARFRMSTFEHRLTQSGLLLFVVAYLDQGGAGRSTPRPRSAAWPSPSTWRTSISWSTAGAAISAASG